MKKGFNKEDQLVSEIMKDFQMKTPSDGFTDRVMQAVKTEKIEVVVPSRPLINRRGWIGIAASLTALLLYILFGDVSGSPTETVSYLDWFPSFSIPAGFGLNTFVRRFSFESPALLWISVAIGCLILLAFIERTLDGLRVRYF